MSRRAIAIPALELESAGRVHRLGGRPWLMGVVNVTPDSFSDGGRYLDPEAAVVQGRQLVADGADVLDVGGESSRPGAQPVSVEEELRRVMPVVQRLAAEVDRPISIDTAKAAVAAAAIKAGAAIINDITALGGDPEMVRVAADTGAAVICMHMQGTPQTMQIDPRYDDVVAEVYDFLEERLSWLETHGVPRRRVIVDPGIGFGKKSEHNLQLLRNLEVFHRLGRPLCVGPSRKAFIGKLRGGSAPDQREPGTLAAVLSGTLRGAHMFRLHEVRATRQAIDVLLAIEGSTEVQR